MNRIKVLEKLNEYKQFEGRKVLIKGSTFEIRKVVAAPFYLPEFMEHYHNYLSHSEQTVMLGLSKSYDIYFLQNYNDHLSSFYRLNEFLAYYNGD